MAWTRDLGGCQLLLYRMIRSGSLVKVTTLFYLVPVVTAGPDFVIFGHRLLPASLTGMVAIVLGLMLVFRKPVADPRPKK
jgi:drug/metabolite transporter (DMT)-like permease